MYIIYYVYYVYYVYHVYYRHVYKHYIIHNMLLILQDIYSITSCYYYCHYFLPEVKHFLATRDTQKPRIFLKIAIISSRC